MRILAVAFATLLACPLPAASTEYGNVSAAADEYLRHAEQLGWFSGAVLVSKNGKVILAKGYGRSNEENNAAAFPSTKFRLASLTKQFTAMAIAILLAKQRLALEDKMCKYYDPCPSAWQEITILQLVNHTSGLPDFAGLPLPGCPGPTAVRDTLSAIAERPLDFAPGTQFRYSNSGYLALGSIIERISGESYDKFLDEQIFGPLGMHDSGYDWPNRILHGRASGYDYEGDTRVNASFNDMQRPQAAGGVYSTVWDMAKWDQALYRNLLIPHEVASKIFNPGLGDYAFGWYISEEFGHKVMRHSGGMAGFSSHIARYPDDHLLIVLLCNLSTVPVETFARDLAAIVLGKPYEVPALPRPATVLLLSRYAGRYSNGGGLIVRVSAFDDHLAIEVARKSPFTVFPQSATAFFRKEVFLPVSFQFDSVGNVASLELHLDKRTLTFAKQQE